MRYNLPAFISDFGCALALIVWIIGLLGVVAWLWLWMIPRLALWRILQ